MSSVTLLHSKSVTDSSFVWMSHLIIWSNFHNFGKITTILHIITMKKISLSPYGDKQVTNKFSPKQLKMEMIGHYSLCIHAA